MDGTREDAAVKWWERFALPVICAASAAIVVLFFTILYFIVRDAIAIPLLVGWCKFRLWEWQRKREQ